ncbi:MAG: hypothetical protein ACJ739_14175 [Acidimicrobiales bacterium]
MTDPDLAVEAIGDVTWRRRVRVRGEVHALRLQPGAEGVLSLEVTLVDDTGGLTIIFLGRRAVAGIELGRQLEAEGMVGEKRGRLAMLNPLYRLLAPV